MRACFGCRAIQERIRHEQALARTIQQGLLPRSLPRGDYFQLQAITNPCETVGGDYYDVVKLPGDRIGVAGGRRGGQGWTAAMLSACLQEPSGRRRRRPDLPGSSSASTTFSASARRWRCSPPCCMACSTGPAGSNCERRTRHALVAHASGEVVRVESSNFPLGLFPEATFEWTASSSSRRHRPGLFGRRHGGPRPSGRVLRRQSHEGVPGGLQGTPVGRRTGLAGDGRKCGSSSAPPSGDDVTLVSCASGRRGARQPAKALYCPPQTTAGGV